MSKERENKTVLDQGVADFSGQEKAEPLKLKKLKKTSKKHNVVADRDPDTGRKRIYRRNEDLFDDTADPKAEVNRLTVRLSTRVSRAHKDVFNAAASRFPNKRAALERAIELLNEDLGLDP